MKLLEGPTSSAYTSHHPLLRSQTLCQLPRAACGFRPARTPDANRYHQSVAETSPYLDSRDNAGSETSTSGQSACSMPSPFEQMVQTLPPRSKRRRILMATSILGSLLTRQRLEPATHGLGRSQAFSGPMHLPLLSAVTASVLPAGGWSDLGHNYIFTAGFWGWFIAQSLKIFTKRYKQGVWDIRAVVESGGMPSSHSALTAAVTTAVALEFGLGSSLFAVALCFTVITMYDAAGVRRHAGKQAEVLNILLEDVLQGHPVSDRKLKEVLGHTPVQVLSGAILGVVVACFVPSPAQLPIV